MEYLVKVWMYDGQVPFTEYHEFYDREEAKEYADYKADKLRASGCYYDVMIYESTNY